MKAAWWLLPAALLAASGAQALETFCLHRGGTAYPGTERHEDWYVVNSKVPRPMLTGQTKRSTGCNMNFNGAYRPLEILTNPKMGEVMRGRNFISYRSPRNGEDSLSVRFHFLRPRGQLESAIIHVRIHVVDKI